MITKIIDKTNLVYLLNRNHSNWGVIIFGGNKNCSSFEWMYAYEITPKSFSIFIHVIKNKNVSVEIYHDDTRLLSYWSSSNSEKVKEMWINNDIREKYSYLDNEITKIIDAVYDSLMVAK